MMVRGFARLFGSRRGHLDYRVNRDFIRNGIATIPCQVNDYHDIISTYSVKGFETLNPDFLDYIRTTAECTPDDCPIVLDIIGGCLTEEEKKTIDYIIRDDLGYDLGIVDKDVKRHRRIFLLMFIGLIIIGVLLWFTEALAETPRELIFILFWFMGDTLCDYIFLTGYDLRREKRISGRLASVKIVFSDTYKEPDYPDSYVEKLYSEIEKDVEKSKLLDE